MSEDCRAFEILREAAEKAMIELSSTTKHTSTIHSSQLMHLMLKLVKDVGITTKEVDEVLLAVGMTLAMGEIIQGGILRGDVKELILLDVTPLSLGIEPLVGLSPNLLVEKPLFQQRMGSKSSHISIQQLQPNKSLERS
ncbi:unnamed protein product [Lactuca saligna]|uniref:Uncharacterized protein n=1 Tax=Lactuca saligna TaxID=75948 RepID=A0AA35UQ97_LACSI|nr:unnamed protein product [Lactuca saligna]